MITDRSVRTLNGNNNDFLVKLSDRRLFLWFFLGLITVLAGVRFSDGSMLLAISRGATNEDSVFKEAATQYVWDSPLKILLLHALPAKILVIAFSFVVLAILPAVGLISKNIRILWLTFATVILTPAFKISVQNVGVGDGLTLVLIMFSVYISTHRLLGTAFFMMALWHPQQSVFIGLSFLLARYCYTEEFDVRGALVVLGSLSGAAVVFFLYKSLLNFRYSGREAYMVQHIGDFLRHNPIYAPIAFAPIILWFLLVAPKPVRGGLLLAAWLLILGSVAVLTTDMTRVMTICTLPIVLVSAARIVDQSFPIPLGKVGVTAILVALIPPCSWSGFDFLLWTDLVRDLCKWKMYCW